MSLLARALTALLLAAAAVSAGAIDAPLSAGARIYQQGLLPSGSALQGARGAGGGSAGVAAACVNCHRRSGLGSAEGNIRVPPITAPYLFARTGVQPGRPTLSGESASDTRRAAYDDPTLAAAIRAGTGRGGRELSYLMPRYALDDADMASLIAYLKSLPTTPSPGVSDTTIDIATIVTPDADPVARDGMLDVLNQFVADKNAFIRGGARPLHSQGQIDFRVTRRWQLHVWTLKGQPDTWEAQLHEHLRAEPVFAVLSGIGGDNWAPVHRFCEAARLPCLFPNVDVPVDAQQDFYSLYLSQGALLEAELIATRLAGGADAHADAGVDAGTGAGAGTQRDTHAHAGRLVQIYARGDGAERAASRLKGLVPANTESVMTPIASGDARALAQAVAQVSPGDTLVLWLRPAELALLGTLPPGRIRVFVSGDLGGLEHAPLPRAWREVAQLTYPVDLPEARAIRMNYPLRWFQIRHVPLVAEKVQADTYLACGIVSEALNEMLDSFMRDFLVERIESMLSHRQLSGYYPRLGLAPGQRFASKGGYLVRFTEPSGIKIAPLSDWITP